jgi:hypothetical protein
VEGGHLGVEADLLAHDVLELRLADGAVGVAQGPVVRDEAEVGPGERKAREGGRGKRAII